MIKTEITKYVLSNEVLDCDKEAIEAMQLTLIQHMNNYVSHIKNITEKSLNMLGYKSVHVGWVVVKNNSGLDSMTDSGNIYGE